MELKPFLIATSQGISGTGVSSKIEHWIDLTSDEFTPVLTFTSEGQYLAFPAGIGRKTGGLVVSLTTQPVEGITVAFHVEFEPVGNGGKGMPVVRISDRVVYVRTSIGKFELDPGLSTATSHEVKAFYDISDADSSDPEFLKFNLKELSALATNKNDERLPWLAKFLRLCPDTPESRKLKALIATPSRR